MQHKKKCSRKKCIRDAWDESKIWIGGTRAVMTGVDGLTKESNMGELFDLHVPDRSGNQWSWVTYPAHHNFYLMISNAHSLES